MEFTFTKRAKMLTYVLMAIGFLAIVIGFFTEDPEMHHAQWWSNLLVNGFFFFAVGLGALFFLVLQYATEAAWATLVKRVFEAIMAYLPIGAAVLAFVFLASTFGWNHIYHWMDASILSPVLEDGSPNENFDAVIAGKTAFLNKPFWWIRTLVYLGTFLYFANFYRKQSLKEDIEGGSAIHTKNFMRSGLFLALFAVFSSTLAWDWLMSIDTHWFSTLYGWYVFSGMWVTAMIMAVVLTLYLKSKGYLENVNKSHIHDLGKWVFAISFLWSYLWFSQFMLIWYSDIPEEVTYFVERIEHFRVPFFTMFFINFAVPMLILMSRDAKRNSKFLITVGMIIFAGHWMDVYLLIMPGTIHHWHFGFMDLGMALGFLGLFLFVVFRAMTKAPIQVKNHPFVSESIQHHI